MDTEQMLTELNSHGNKVMKKVDILYFFLYLTCLAIKILEFKSKFIFQLQLEVLSQL